MEAKTHLFVFLVFVTFLCHSQCELQCEPATTDGEVYERSSFQPENNEPLSRLTLHSNNIYIAGDRTLVHLSMDLEKQVEVQNNETQNIKIVAVSQNLGKLVTCGAGESAGCQIRDLDNVGMEEDSINAGLEADVVSTDGVLSAVGLIAYGRDPNKESLYVARSGLEKPIIERQLESEDEENRETFGLASEVKETFLIHYKKSFFYEGFVYFLAVQQAVAKDPDSPFVSKLSRLCPTTESVNFDSFTEMKLSCKIDSRKYELAEAAFVHGSELFVVFSMNGEVESSYQPTNQSALCIFNMTEILADFKDAVDSCGCEESNSNNNYLNLAACGLRRRQNPNICVNPSDSLTSIIDNLSCEAKGFFTYPEQDPEQPVTENPVWEGSGTYSSIAVTNTSNIGDHKIAFIGTKEGHLLKVNLEGEICGPYEVVNVGSAVLSDTTFADDEEESLLVLTESKVLKLDVVNCQQFTTCERCIRPGTPMGDPYCGWCTLSKRCTRFDECSKNDEPSRWLSYSESNCSAITEVSPRSLSIEEGSKELVLTVDYLPELSDDEKYKCYFGSFFRTDAVVDENKLNCTSPPRNTIPDVPRGSDHVDVDLSVFSSETEEKFVTREYQFYDCSRITSCSLCVNSKWRCDWCKFSHRCTQDSSTCNDVIIPGSYSLQNASTAADTCPQIIRGGMKYLVPNGVGQELSFTAKNLPPLSDSRVTGYKCHLTSMDSSGDMSVDYEVEADISTGDGITFSITCGRRAYSYSEDSQEHNTELALKWNDDNMIDGYRPVTLYKCESGRPDCSRCLSPITTNETLSCVWCQASQQCTFHEQCTGQRAQDCPAPKITDVRPLSAPLNGGTRVIINGTNLGQSVDDITSITLAGQSCQRVDDSYVVGERIECTAAGTNAEVMGDVTVTVDGEEGTYTEKFHYNDPVIKSFMPEYGPQSGGTTLTIIGSKLDTGNGVLVSINEFPCQFQKRNRTAIECKTGPVDSLINGKVNVSFDKTTHKIADGLFGYLEDPTVVMIEPMKSIRSGGTTLTVTGTNFDLVQKPLLIAKSNAPRSKVIEQKCSMTDETTLQCFSPNVTSFYTDGRRRRQAEEPETSLIIGFKMDGVTSLENWSEDNGVTFEVFEDPIYDKFPGEVLEFAKGSDTSIEIKGSNIDVATTRGDVKVYIGNKLCTIVVFQVNLIQCEPPTLTPNAGDIYKQRTSRGLPYVVVKHGENLVFDIGYIRYTTDPIIYYIIMVCVILVLIIIVAILIIYCMRKSKNKQVERLLFELTAIPEIIGEELRVLFAMLQTAMDKFETNPEGLPVLPLIDRSQYVENMLFLNLKYQPTTEPLMNSEEIDAMKKFSELIYNKSFLLVFIRTLDNERNLPMKERVNIASLITLALLLEGKLDYLTDVMVTLMGEEIEDIVDKNRPKQLFKRNESIVEKLVSNWVAICLYDYLQTTAAEKIVQLCGAIQCVVEKGPIDAMSGKSQFSLDDEHMLDSHISFEEVNLQVVANEEDGEITTVTVLDVDTITQVKNKILDHLHRGRPYSTRTSTLDMDLEWRQGVSGQLVLRDVSANQEVVDGWKKINTLKDYKVENGCRVALIKKQANPNAQLADKSENMSASVTDEYESDTESACCERSLGCFAVARVRQSSDDDLYETSDINESSFLDSATIAEKIPLNRSPTLVEAKVEEGINLWHLIKDTEGDDLHTKSKSKSKLQKKGIKEVLLPLLPATRNALQKYVDGAFDVMLSANEAEVPKCIKYLFDFFDRQASKYNLDSPDVISAWKNNVLPLRFWTTILANPTYIFDMRQSSYVEACLRVLVQVLRDACSKSDFKLDKNSSPCRLLYASMLPTYTEKVETYYRHIQELPRLNPDATKEEYANICRPFQGLFNPMHTMFQLYQFAKRFNESLNVALEEDDDCQNANLVYRMEQVGITLNE